VWVNTPDPFRRRYFGDLAGRETFDGPFGSRRLSTREIAEVAAAKGIRRIYPHRILVVPVVVIFERRMKQAALA